MKFELTGIDFSLITDDDAIEKALKDAMLVLVSSTKDAISSHRRTGSLMDSIGCSKPKQSADGSWYSGITFKGKDGNGTSNGLKAAELEYGNSRQPATPFADRAINSAEGRIKSIIEKNLENLIKVGE